jgi:hypothetical protein
MPVDNRYKGNRQVKDAGQKPQNAEDKEYIEMIQQQTTFEADAEGGNFRYSENYQNFDPEKEDYSDLEYTYPPFNPPPFDPWFNPVLPKDDPPGGGDVTNEFGCKDPSLCWCPDEERCGQVSCTQEAVAAEPLEGDSGASCYCYHNKLCVTGSEATPQSLAIKITMQSRTQIPSGEVRTQAQDVVTVEKCKADKCCNCLKSKIAYTSNQMNGGEAQNLSATNISDACKNKAKVTWAASSGSFDKTTGRDVVFTAPAQNANCDASADVTLYCNGNVIDTLHVTINTSGTGIAVVVNSCGIEGSCQDDLPGITCLSARVDQTLYDCAGNEYRVQRCMCWDYSISLSGDCATLGSNCPSWSVDNRGGIGCAPGKHCLECSGRGVTAATCADISAHLTTANSGGHDDYYPCVEITPSAGTGRNPAGAGALGTYLDVRTQAMKDAGCCPPQLS